MIFRHMTKETTPLSGVALSLYIDVNFMVIVFFMFRHIAVNRIISKSLAIEREDKFYSESEGHVTKLKRELMKVTLYQVVFLTPFGGTDSEFFFEHATEIMNAGKSDCFGNLLNSHVRCV